MSEVFLAFESVPLGSWSGWLLELVDSDEENGLESGEVSDPDDGSQLGDGPVPGVVLLFAALAEACARSAACTFCRRVSVASQTPGCQTRQSSGGSGTAWLTRPAHCVLVARLVEAPNDRPVSRNVANPRSAPVEVTDGFACALTAHPDYVLFGGVVGMSEVVDDNIGLDHTR